MPPPIDLADIRLFDVLSNSLNGELGSVLGVEGDKIDLAVKSGAIVRYKHGAHFCRVPEDAAIAFRSMIQALRRERALANPKKRRKAPLRQAAQKTA